MSSYDFHWDANLIKLINLSPWFSPDYHTNHVGILNGKGPLQEISDPLWLQRAFWGESKGSKPLQGRLRLVFKIILIPGVLTENCWVFKRS